MPTGKDWESVKQRKWRSIGDMGLKDPYAQKKIAKVRITLFLDSDIVLKFKEQSAEKNKGYQTLINEFLRTHLIWKRKNTGKENHAQPGSKGLKE